MKINFFFLIALTLTPAASIYASRLQVVDLSPIPRTEKTPLEKLGEGFSKRMKESQQIEQDKQSREQL